MPTIVPYETKEEWLKLRAEDITSTEVSALFTDPANDTSLSPYFTEYELYHIKKGLAEDSFEENERMKWGKRQESMIAEGIAEDLDIEVEFVSEYMRHSEEPRMGSSFDFRIINHKEGIGNLEIKGVDKDIYRYGGKWSDDEAPDHIELQVQHQMEVADIDWTLICVLVGGNEPKFIERKRDRQVGAALRKATRRFWQSIKDGIPPAPHYARDSDFIISLHQSAGVNMLESDDEEMIDRLRCYNEAGKVIKEHTDDRKNIKARILKEVGDDYNQVKAGGFKLHCGMTKETPKTVITENMIGESFGGRKSYRNFKVYAPKEEK